MKHLGDYYISICHHPCLEIKFSLIPITMVVMLMSDPNPELVEFLDREPDTGYNQNVLSNTILKRPQVGPPRREQLQPEVAQLRNKVKDLEVMLQKL